MPAEFDGYFRAHRPIGVVERFIDGRLGDALLAPGAERSAGGGDDHAFDAGGVLAAKRLENRVVLTVHRQQPHAHFRRHPHEGHAGADETFLIGQRHVAPGRERGVGRLHAGGADDGRDDEIGVAQRGLDDRLATRGDLSVGPGERFLERRIGALVADRGEFGSDRAGDARQRLDIAAARHRRHRKSFRIAFEKVDRRTADRACRAQQHDAARGRRAGLGRGVRVKLSVC